MISFLLLAVVIFALVKVNTKVVAVMEPEGPSDNDLLVGIRDLLQQRYEGTS